MPNFDNFSGIIEDSYVVSSFKSLDCISWLVLLCC